MNFNNEFNKKLEILDRELSQTISYNDEYLGTIVEAMEYSLFTGGKRIRPILSLEAFDLFNHSGDYKDILPFAMAVEMIHTYSLVHDDLPAMDDDDMRRGKPTSHIKYGEAMAILAGDGLLNLAFEIASNSINLEKDDRELVSRKVRALQELSKYSGIEGMIGGQVVDLHLLEAEANENYIKYMYENKTAALIRSALVMGAIIAGASDSEVEIMREFGLNLGMAYQIKDDFLDLEEDQAIDKVTYVSVLGLDRSKDDLRQYTDQAIENLRSLDNERIGFLLKLTEKLARRDY